MTRRHGTAAPGAGMNQCLDAKENGMAGHDRESTTGGRAAGRRMAGIRQAAAVTVLVAVGLPGPALAGAPFSCGGFAQLGGAQLLCSHVDPTASTQICTYSWTLAGAGGSPSVVQGTFTLVPGQSNVTVYQGNGFGYALGTPVVLCQGRRRGP